MTLTDLSKQLATQGFHRILVKSLPDEEGLSFIGSFDEYMEAAKALGARVLFVSTFGISEKDFSHYTRPVASWPFPTTGKQPIVDSIAKEDAETEIDLCSIVPELKKYKQRIGEDGRFDLLCASGSHSLTFSIVEKWMEDFEDLRLKAEGIMDEKSDAEQSLMLEKVNAQQAEVNVKKREAMQKLQDLVSDRKFSALRTQREMLIYATNKIPELSKFDERDLKRVIGDLKAKIKVKELDA